MQMGSFDASSQRLYGHKTAKDNTEHRAEASTGFASANSDTKLPTLKRQTLHVTGLYFDDPSSCGKSNKIHTYTSIR
jgi:hypothetical protein